MIDFLLDLISFFLPKEKVDTKTLILESPPLNVPRSFEVLGHLVSFVQHPEVRLSESPEFKGLKYFQASLRGKVLPRIYTGHSDPWLHYDLRVALGEDPLTVGKDLIRKFDYQDFPEKRLVRYKGHWVLYEEYPYFRVHEYYIGQIEYEEPEYTLYPLLVNPEGELQPYSDLEPLGNYPRDRYCLPPWLGDGERYRK